MAARRTHLVLALAVRLLTYTPVTHAQALDSEDAQADAAKALTKAGVADYTAGRYAEAAAKFSEAYRTYPKSELLLNLTRTEKHLTHCDKALDYAQRYVKTVSGSDPALEQSGLDELAHLRADCPEVQVLSNPPGALLWLETDTGAALGTTPWTGRVYVGHRVFILKAPGLPDSHQSVELVTGSTPMFTFNLGPTVAEAPTPPLPAPVAPPVAPPEPAVVAPPPAAPEFTALPEEHPALPPAQIVERVAPPRHLEENHPRVEHHMSTLKTVGWVATVVGAVALTTAIILGVNVQSETAGLQSSYHPGNQAQSIINDTQTKSSAANALFGIGGVSAAAGLGLVLFF